MKAQTKQNYRTGTLIIPSLLILLVQGGIISSFTIIIATAQIPNGQQQSIQEEQFRLNSAISQKEQESLTLERTRGCEEQFLELGRKVGAAGTIPVIVRIRAPFRPENELSGPYEVLAQRSVLGRARERFRDEIAGYDPASIKEFGNLPYTALRVNSTGLESLRTSPTVIDIEEDRLHRVSLTKSIPIIGADKAWTNGYTGSGQAIAIIDTGVDKNHPFLAGKVVAEGCYSTNGSGSTSFCPGGVASSNSSDSGLPCAVSSDCSHGTHVAGIAAGKGNAFSGVAKDASIIAIQVFSRFDSVTTCGGFAPCAMAYSSDIIRGLQWVYELRSTHAIAAVNLSLGGGRYTSECDTASAATKSAIDLLRSVGIATIVATGNESYTNATGSPACISTAISVGSVPDSSGSVSRFSNSAPFLSLLAPGESITSSTVGSSFETWSGTSMASPHVTGAWAILKQKSPTASVSQILRSLTSTGRPVTDSRNNITTPLIRIDEALTAPASPEPPPSLPKSPTALDAMPISANQINLSWTDNSSNETSFKVYRRTDEASSLTLVSTVAANTATFQNTGLAGGTTYRYYVVSSNQDGDSQPSNEAQATTLNPPVAPSSLVATSVSTTQINLSWKDPSNNETGFRIRRRSSSNGMWTVIGTVGANVTSFISSGLSPGQTYYFVVTTYNPTGESLFSNQVSSTTSPTSRPDQPLSLFATPVSSTEIILSWQDTSTNEIGFRISRKTGSLGTWAVIGTVVSGSTTARNTGLNPATSYTFRVTAFNSAGESNPTNEAIATTPDAPPLPPTSITAEANSESEVNLTWSDRASNESGFRIFRKTESDGSWAVIGSVGANITTFRNSGLSASTTYLYRITAWNSLGESASSMVVSVATPSTAGTTPAPPRSLQATAISKTGVSLAWIDNSTNETGFAVQRRNSFSPNWLTIAVTRAGTTTYDDSGLSSGNTYLFRVKALSGTLESIPSNEVGVVLPVNAFTNLGTIHSVTGSVSLGAERLFQAVCSTRCNSAHFSNLWQWGH